MKKQEFGLYFVLIAIFLLYPLIAFIIALYFLLKDPKNKLFLILVVLFVGLFGYSFKPIDTMDITRHYYVFESLKDVISFSDFIFYESINGKPDFFLDYSYWLIGKVVKTHQIIGSIGSICYYGLLWLCINNWLLLNSKMNQFKLRLLLLLMFLAFIPVHEFNGMRQGTSIALFLYLITIPHDRVSGLKRILLLLIPCMIHFSLYPIVFFYICTIFFKRRMIIFISACLILGSFYFLSLMEYIQNICISLGSVGIGIAMKIDDYLFSGDVEVKLYSGSVIRFVFISFLFLLFPILFCISDKYIKKRANLISRFHYFSLLFYSYIIFTSSSYILSRNFMLFKFVVILYIVYILYSLPLNRFVKKLLYGICLLICLSGSLSFFLGKEYRTINTALYVSNLYQIIHIETKPEGYSLN